MKSIDWTKAGDERVKPFPRDGMPLTYTAARVLVGHCPDCKNVLVVFNDHESWPLVGCQCGWQGDTLSLDTRTRYENDGSVSELTFADDRPHRA